MCETNYDWNKLSLSHLCSKRYYNVCKEKGTKLNYHLIGKSVLILFNKKTHFVVKGSDTLLINWQHAPYVATLKAKTQLTHLKSVRESLRAVLPVMLKFKWRCSQEYSLY